jgi:glycosyltransferase involved in cell wall biosynthesis
MLRFAIIIPTYNEEAFIEQTLASLVAQTHMPEQIIVVNDGSTDNTTAIVESFAARHSQIQLVHKSSEAIHLPGSKVIQAFQAGEKTLTIPYDVIAKFDADLIFPPDYIATLNAHFEADSRVGMVGGFCYIEKNGTWILENLTDKDHIRGALKAYRREAFKAIGGLRPQMGWDTVDELLCHFYDWKIVTDKRLHVKHLKPTGASYNQAARFKQGEAFYTLGYGFWITAIAALKLAQRKQKPLLFWDYLRGYWKAQKAQKPMLVTPEQAHFIRRYRWQKMRSKLHGFWR